jgi:hypothetical protein
MLRWRLSIDAIWFITCKLHYPGHLLEYFASGVEPNVSMTKVGATSREAAEV